MADGISGGLVVVSGSLKTRQAASTVQPTSIQKVGGASVSWNRRKALVSAGPKPNPTDVLAVTKPAAPVESATPTSSAMYAVAVADISAVPVPSTKRATPSAAM